MESDDVGPGVNNGHSADVCIRSTLIQIDLLTLSLKPYHELQLRDIDKGIA
jgi:hypothetical protein